jgi:hypothetical protein
VECGRSDESVGQANPALSSDLPSPFSHLSIYRKLSEWSQQSARLLRRRRTGKQLRSRDHRVVQSMLTRFELHGAAQVVDENVGVHQQISHDPTHRGRVPLPRGQRQMSRPVLKSCLRPARPSSDLGPCAQSPPRTQLRNSCRAKLSPTTHPLPTAHPKASPITWGWLRRRWRRRRLLRWRPPLRPRRQKRSSRRRIAHRYRAPAAARHWQGGTAEQVADGFYGLQERTMMSCRSRTA